MLQRRILKYQQETLSHRTITKHNSCNNLFGTIPLQQQQQYHQQYQQTLQKQQPINNQNNNQNNNIIVLQSPPPPSQPIQQIVIPPSPTLSIDSCNSKDTIPSPVITSSDSEYLSFTSASTLCTVNSYQSCKSTASSSDYNSVTSEIMSDTSFHSPKSSADGADIKLSKSTNTTTPPTIPTESIENNNNNSNNNQEEDTENNNENSSSNQTSPKDREESKWSLLHSKMKILSDKMDPKRGSVLIEHLSEYHKLATSQVMSGEEEDQFDQKPIEKTPEKSNNNTNNTSTSTTTTTTTTTTSIISSSPTSSIDSPILIVVEPKEEQITSPDKQNTTSTTTTTTTTSTTPTLGDHHNDEAIQDSTDHHQNGLVECEASLTKPSSGIAAVASETMIMVGVNLFNEKPQKGVEYFFNCRLLDRTPQAVSEFLHTCPLLDKKAIGDCLGERDNFSISVLESFIARFDFEDLDFDMALRQLLYTFRLPGEAQKIDRIVQRFANQYYKDNVKSGIFEDPDAIYLLAFATILLNTDVHHPQVKLKMTKQKFIKSLARVNNGKDFPVDFVEELFDRIFQDEIKMDPSQAKFPYAVKKGWLNIRVKGKVTEKWSRKWCILSEGSLYFFRKPGDTVPVRYLHPDTVITPKKEVKGKKNCFMVNHSSPPLLLELLQQQQEKNGGKSSKLSQQWVYQQMLIMSSKQKSREPRFWDAIVEKQNNGNNDSQLNYSGGFSMDSTSSHDILDSDSVGSIDTLSESSAFYDEESSSLSNAGSSISSSNSSSPNSPLSTSNPQNNSLNNYLNTPLDSKKKAFSLRLGKQKKEQMATLQEHHIPPLLPPPSPVNSAGSHAPPIPPRSTASNNNQNASPNNNTNHSLTQPRPPTFKAGGPPSTLMRSTSISTFSTPSTPTTTSAVSTPTSSSSTPPISKTSTTNNTPTQPTLMSMIESSQQIEQLMKLQQKMAMESTKQQSTVLLSTDSKRDMESWTRLILSQFKKKKI